MLKEHKKEGNNIDVVPNVPCHYLSPCGLKAISQNLLQYNSLSLRGILHSAQDDTACGF